MPNDSTLVERTALMRRLDRLAPVTVLQALPGHGKTSLVTHWAERQEAAGAAVTWWADPRADLAVAAGQSTSAGITIVVVDDVHRWSRDTVEALCAAVVSSPELHLVACADGPHWLTEVAREHRIKPDVVSGAELRVSSGEIVELAQAWGHEITHDDAVDLRERTGGWLRPVRDVLDAAARSGGGWIIDPARPFVREQVLAVLADTGDLDTVSRLAVAPLLTEPLAAALLDVAREDARETLSRLVSFGSLERLSVERGVARWRTPRLLRDAVWRGVTDGASHRLVARSLLELGDSAELGHVLHHARRGSDWTVLAELWTTRTFALVINLPAETASAYAGLPAEALAEFPVLGVPTAMADALRAGATERGDDGVLQGFAAAGRQALVARDLPGQLAIRSIAIAATMMSLRTDGSIEVALKLATAHDRELSGHRGPSWAQESTSWFLLTWGVTAMQASDHVTAIPLLEWAFEAARAADSRSLAQHGAGLLAMLHAVVGDPGRAGQWLETHDRLMSDESRSRARPAPASRLALAILALDRMDGETAEAELSRLEHGRLEEIWPIVMASGTRRAVLYGGAAPMLARVDELATVHAAAVGDDGLAGRMVARVRTDLLLALGAVDRARAMIEREPTLAGWLRVPAARLALMTGRPEEAALLASSGAWDDAVPPRDAAELQMIAASALVELGDLDAAGAAFERGHALASAVGTATPYIVMPARARDRILDHLGLQLPEHLVTAIHQVTSPYPVQSGVVTLSPRERQVLQMIGEDVTTAQMAQRLTVSVNTVKKQRASVYAKLGVHSRAEALARAAELGLLPR